MEPTNPQTQGQPQEVPVAPPPNIPEMPQAVTPPTLEPPKKKNPILVVAIILFILSLLAIAGYVALGRGFLTKPKACTMDVKVCPDGSYVGRVGPNCEFAPCPVVPSPTLEPTPEATSSATPTATPTP